MSQISDPPSDPRALPPGGGLVQASALRALASPSPEPAQLSVLPSEEETHFWDYWRVLVRHRWTVISFFLVTGIVGTVWTFTTRPVYTATVMLRIEKEEPKVVKFEEVVKADPQQDYYQTQHRILQSRTLASRVIGFLQLDQHPDFQQLDGESGWLPTAQAWARERLVRWIPVVPPPPPEATEDLLLESPLTRAFQNRLSVEPVRNARLVKVSFEGHYPDLAARVANTLAEAFIAQQLDQKVEATRYATQFLSKQMEEAREKLEASEEKLNQFLKARNILFITPDKVGERQDLITQQLITLSDALLKARGDRIARESLIHQALNQEANSIPAVLQSPLIAKLKEELVTLEGEYRKIGQIFKPEYPRMLRLAENIAEVRRQLREEVRRVVEALDADYRAALRNERALEQAVDEHRRLAQRFGDQVAEYNLLRREVDTIRDLYTSLLTRLKETQVSAALFTSNISIVDRAEIPLAPSKPRKGLNLILAIVIGLFGGVGLAFFLEYLDTNIKDPKEVETVLQVPILGVVPSRAALEGRRARRQRQLAEGGGKGLPFALMAQTEKASVLAETFRNVRTSLLYSAPDHPPKTLLVTSLQTEDGKTSLATNLAITLAQLGIGEVLLVDGDMRRPDLHEILRVPQVPGLSTFLTGQAELPAVLKPTMVQNLYIIPAGRTPLNPAELMASRRLGQALEVLGERFAHIVFDSPPLFGVSDAMILAPRVEGVILVLRHGQASRDAAQRAVRLLASVRARLLGVVLNDVNIGAGGAAYGYYGYYGYGYGSTARSDA